MSNFDELRNIADGFLGKYPEDQAWNGSSFNWMRRLAPGADAWIDVDPEAPAAWLAAYGGTIDQAIAHAKKSL